MKKIFKKLISGVVVTLMMITTLTGGVFASDALTGKVNVTVNGLDKNNTSTVKAYQVIDVTVDSTGDNPKTPVYTWNSSVSNWVSENYSTYIDTKDSNAVTSTFMTLTDQATIKAFYDDLSYAIGNGTISLSASATATGTSSATLSLSKGGYVFIISDGVNVYSPVFTKVYPEYKNDAWVLSSDDISESGTIKLSTKKSTPSIEKEVVDPSDKTVAIGDTVEYKVTVTIPHYESNAIKKTIKINDALPTGLTLSNSDIKVVNDQDTPSEVTDYFTISTDDNELSLVLKTSDDYNYNKLVSSTGGNVNAKIVITYKAIVNDVAYKASTLKNTANLTYSVEPYSTTDTTKTISGDAQVYTYGLKVIKTLKNDTTTSKEGIEFTLTEDGSKDALKFSKHDDGYYYIDSTNGSATLSTDSNGNILIKGLDIGTYTLSETKAPAGYPLSSYDTTITLAQSQTTASDLDNCTVSGSIVVKEDSAIDTTDKNQYNLTLENDKDKFTLPLTGGMGTVIFTVGGILLMALAVYLLRLSSKKNNEKA